MLIELFVSLEDYNVGFNEYTSMESFDPVILDQMRFVDGGIEKIDIDRWSNQLFSHLDVNDEERLKFIAHATNINEIVNNDQRLVLIEFGVEYDITWVVMSREMFEQLPTDQWEDI